MTPDEKEYVRYRRERTRHSLEVARFAFENNHLQDAVNRLYYACFYMVSALLLTRGLSSSKHTGVRSLFFQHWVKTGLIPVSMGHFYQDLFEYRQEGDYGDRVTFAHEDVERWMVQSGEFIEAVSRQIECAMGREDS